MRRSHRLAIGCLIAICATQSWAYHCDRTPERAAKPANKVDINRYIIEISGNPKSYAPGQNYTITLKSNPSIPNRNRFTEFTLVVEPENQLDSFQTSATGYFQLIDMLTRFSIRCRNTVTQTNTLAKTSINVAWIAPATKSGCVAIKGTVFESVDNWFSDDGELTKILCEEDTENEDFQPAVLKRCCACDEAKYEVAFQGMWSRNTHPKYYPTDVWTTKFSDIVGASHKVYKSFWNYGGMASPGLKLLGEEGDTKLLETELKEMVKSDDIRTLIKARELTYPNITGTSYTVFRADRDNHVISLVSKITPSPDWIVGVANLELCLRNCSWIESRVLNLYPWDIGTDYGYSYTSPDTPSIPQESIKRIKSNSPNREESPFYDEDGEPLKPVAKLYLTRQKLYEKVCDSQDPSGSNEEVDGNCGTTEWSEWSACSDICIQFRKRDYVSQLVPEACQKQLVETVPCKGPKQCESVSGIDPEDTRCTLSEWSQWSSCSVSCVRTRDRTFLQAAYQEACTSEELPLQENEECGSSCENFSPPNEEECLNTVWGEWTPCNATCGTGFKERFRTTKTEDEEESDDSSSCESSRETVECYNEPCAEEEIASSPFGPLGTGRSQVTDAVVVTEGADGPVVDCKVSKWSIWSACNASEPCKKGYKFKERRIKVHAQNGGKQCPRKLQKKRKCKADCSNSKKNSVEDSRETHPTWGPSQPPSNEDVDCVMGHWSAWSPCSKVCGGSAVQQRTRAIKVYPSRNGKQCLSRIQEKICPLPLACTDRGTLPIY